MNRAGVLRGLNGDCRNSRGEEGSSFVKEKKYTDTVMNCSKVLLLTLASFRQGKLR